MKKSMMNSWLQLTDRCKATVKDTAGILNTREVGYSLRQINSI